MFDPRIPQHIDRDDLHDPDYRAYLIAIGERDAVATRDATLTRQELARERHGMERVG